MLQRLFLLLLPLMFLGGVNASASTYSWTKPLSRRIKASSLDSSPSALFK